MCKNAACKYKVQKKWFLIFIYATADEVDAYMFYRCFFWVFFSFLAHSKNELMQWRGVHRPSVRPSVNFFCANRFFSQTNGRIATKLAHDGHQVSLHPGCAQGQGQRSRNTRTFLDSWNELFRH